MPNPPDRRTLWHRRMSTPSPPTSPEPIRLDIDPFDTYPPTMRRKNPINPPPLRRRASGRKPPIMPPLKSGMPKAVDVSDVCEEMGVVMSPVSSFVGSAPGSPREGVVAAEVEHLERQVAAWDGRLGEMERRVERAWEEVRRVRERLGRAGVGGGW
eukprot:GFKZ01006478.1.p1 GENE.GFKZ01006478.1~~GFKZ01006478.1.p1  ORF type:complete len:156 (+),score=22.75 GFKZ01006478.1:3-470(+)